MRINSGLNQQANAAQNKDLGQVKLEVGKTIQGKVLTIEGNNLTLQTNEGAVKVINASNMALSLDSILQFEIVNQEDGVFVAKAVMTSGQTSQGQAALNEEVVKTLLGQEGPSILEAMKTLNLPISQANYDQIKTMGLELKVLSQILSQNPRALNDQTVFNGDLKTLIKVLDGQMPLEAKGDLTSQFKEQVTLVKDYIGHEINRILEGGKQLGLSDGNLREASSSGLGLKNLVAQLQSNLDFTSLNQTAIKSEVSGLQKAMTLVQNMALDDLDVFMTSISKDGKSTTNTLINTLQESADINSQPAVESSKLSSTSNEKLVSSVFKTLIDQFSNDNKALFLKNKTPLNLKNILLNAMVSEGVKSIDSSIQKINHFISSLPKETQSQVLALIEKGNIDSIESLMKFLDASSMDTQAKAGLKHELGFVKDMVQMTSHFGDQVMVLQLPVTIEDRSKTVSMYMKKRQRSDENEDQFSILVALNTHELGEVRCLVEKQKDHFGLHFKLENQEIKDLFENEQKLLKDRLMDLGIEDLTMDFAVSQDIFPGVLLEKRVQNGNFDMSV